MKINHRRKNPALYPDIISPGRAGVGKSWQYVDKSMQVWGRTSTFADRRVSASINNDFANGHRGMAKSVRGAKKFIRSRIRAADKMQLRLDISST